MNMKYNAFISYSHNDEKFAQSLHKTLEGYLLPKMKTFDPDTIVKRKNSLYPIFRDREELPTASDLSTMINDALESSRYLILLCSECSAESQWVNAEIQYFIDCGRADKILPVLLPGNDIVKSISSILREAINYGSVNKFYDARDGLRVLKRDLVSKLCGVSKSDLKKHERKRARKNVLLWSLVGVFILLSLLVYGLYLGFAVHKKLYDEIYPQNLQNGLSDDLLDDKNKFKGEEILNVTRAKQTNVYFVKGHGERDCDSFERAGLGNLVSAIKRANYNVVPLDLLKQKRVPEDCDILFIAGPTKSFSTEETNYIRDYLGTSARLVNDKGEIKDGKLLVMLEPAVGASKSSGLIALLAEYGIIVREDTVVYNKVNMPLFGIQTVVEIYISDQEYLEHVITEEIKKQTSVFYGSSVLSLAPLTDTMAFSAKGIVQAPDNSWGETEVVGKKRPKYDEDSDISSPIILAAVSELRDAKANHTAPTHDTKTSENIRSEGPRVVVFGDTDFASNMFFGNPSNQYLVLNSLRWLSRREE